MDPGFDDGGDGGGLFCGSVATLVFSVESLS